MWITLTSAFADRRAVVQIMVNLLANAAKFTAPEGRLGIRAACKDRRIEVTISDSGIGIAPAHLPRLFTYFEQLGAKQTAQMKGSGIGLALTKALVEKMGGEISVSSEPGRGSEFTFTLKTAGS